jgi:large subunit ribosomal protein L1
MTRLTKRFKDIKNLLGKDLYSLEEAVDILKKCPLLKFDQTVELSLKMGVDPKKADQQVRGTVLPPHGTGKKIKILVFTKDEKEAKDAGADFAGHAEIIEKIKGGWTNFDVVISSPDMMREVGKLGKILGPRGLMPSPKSGTVTKDIAKAIKELKAGKIEFKVDKNSLINVVAGKLSFKKEDLIENIKSIISAINRAKPPGAKGIYMKFLSVSSTMGPGLKIDLGTVI